MGSVPSSAPNPSVPNVLAAWLARGRGDALRHLGWIDLCRRLSDQLSMELARQALLDELEAIEAVLGGETPEGIAEHRSAGVAAALRRLPSIRPLDDLHDARARLRELDGISLLWQLESQAGASGQVRRSLRELEDLDATLEAARRGSALAVVELVGVAELCRAAGVVGALLRAADEQEARLHEEDARGLAAMRARLRQASLSEHADTDEGETTPVLVELPDLLGLLDRSIDRDSEEPRIADAASPELAAARKHARTCKQRLLAKADRLLRGSELSEALRDRYWTEREGRIVLPIRSDALGVVRGQGAIIHGASGSGNTFFVEPGSLIEDNNALREAESRALDEERKVRRELTRRVAERVEVLAGMQRALVELDRMQARALLSEQLGGVTPELVDDVVPAAEPGPADVERGIELRTARHPLMLLDGVDVVPSDLVLARGHALVISGPNAGGKTVSLKTLGLCALMAAAGLRLPCRGRPRMPLFRHVITDVGDDQSIAANLSTFSAHIHHVRQAVHFAEHEGAATLVLLDEIAVGTDPEQGAALAEAILLHLVEAGATVIVTTHYDRLKLLATRKREGDQPAPRGAGRFHNAAVGFDIQRMRPTFRLTLGVPGSSSAIAVARRLGLVEPILHTAERLLDHEGLKVDELLRQIDAERQSLVRTRERLEKDKQRLAVRDKELREREKKALEGMRSRKVKAYAAAAEQLQALERELKQKRKELRRAEPARVDELPTRDQITAEARDTLAQHREADEHERERDKQPAPERLAVGMRVKVLSVGQEGEVVALSGKKVTVQLPMSRTTVKLEDLARVEPTSTAPKLKVKPSKAAPILDFSATIERQAAAHFGAEAVPVKPGFDNVCDVRGQRYEDAQQRVEDFVAQAIARDQDVILIRHGVGSGALRSAVREVLGRLRSVRTFRAGLSPEGGEAVTVAWIE